MSKELVSTFEGTKVRSVMEKGVRRFVVVDIIQALTDTDRPSKYWLDMQVREKIELSAICGTLKVTATDGKKYAMDCVNLEGAFRLIQSIPSSKAEPFKQWMAKTAVERLEEEANPELAIRRGRQRAIEKLKRDGHSDEWITERIEGIETRVSLTDIFRDRGVKAYGILTNANHKGTFGLSVKDHKNLKGLPLKGVNLRSNMVKTELHFNTLSESMLKTMIKNSGAETGEEVAECVRKHAAHMDSFRKSTENLYGEKVAKAETPIKRLT